MSFGFSVSNLDNATLVDSSYQSYVVDSVNVVTTTTAADGGIIAYIPTAKRFYDGSVYAIRRLSDPNNTINNPLNTRKYTLEVWDGRFIMPSAGTYEILTLRNIKNVAPPSGSSAYGLEVYSDTGALAFSSNYQLFRITHLLSIALNGSSPFTGQWTFDYPQMPFNKPIYYMFDGRDRFKKDSGVYWYYTPTGMVTSGTQTTISLQRSSVADVGLGTSSIFRTYLGIIV